MEQETTLWGFFLYNDLKIKCEFSLLDCVSLNRYTISFYYDFF